jgi:hypothetical protein
MYNGLY